ncbi:MAG TPA: hypothetical protein VGE27_03830 [Gemmatimonas sp.]|uniref:hypothetical protein n=1 Tax=Gemmatimonas sp. TaxID=1962908 RepID=UPI002EDB3823
MLLLTLCAVVLSAAACGESLDGGAACPALCPSPSQEFRDTTFEAVVQDTSVSGFPTLGLSTLMLLANRPDTVVTRGVLRFDVLATSFYPNGTGALDSITTVDSVYLRLPLDTTGRRGTAPVTLEVFDVDTTASDSVTAVVSSLFRADRRIGSITVIPSLTSDTLRVPISRTVVQQKIAGKKPLRVGLRLSGGAGQLRLVAFTFSTGAPTLRYDASTDTTYSPITVATNTSIANATVDVNLAYQVYTIVDKGSPAAGPDALVVGGYPAYRSYLRFAVPRRITDSSTIVRAELLLTQRRSTFANAADSVAIVALVPTTTGAVVDMRRILDLSADGMFASIDTTRLVPRDSGLKAINVLTLARSWALLPTDVPRALAFRINREGAQPSELRFFSSKATQSSLRPRLRITYLPRADFALP